ncbi:alpha/beta hydrolase [Phanerochaete sordida]|uniref:Alpha/beta hydrolase n=1 Tax=Phanerochaete sordida TaxID=48140 RepID=A0A9P3LIW4_9APHY|nr:alpha/beta hydrolase [Phanerochaete sordida]
MIGHSFPEYVFIRLCIVCLRLIAPLSITYVAACIYSGRWLYSPWIGYAACVEASFYLFVYLPRSYWLQKSATPPEPLTREERETLFAKCFARVRDTDLATGWFYFSPSHAIRRENVVEWILWAFFSSSRDQLRDEWREEIEEYIHALENLLGRKIEPGRNQEIDCMKVSLDPVTSLHRPFLWYCIVYLVDTYTTLYLAFHGFRHYTLHRWFCYFPIRVLSTVWTRSPHPQLSYWYRPHRSKTKKPIIFLHGIGIGLWPYLPFLQELAAQDPDVGILAFENFPMSMRISPPPLTRLAMLDAMQVVLKHHDIDEFVVCGHSYGTVLAAHIMRSPTLAQRVTAWLLVDPIPFLLHLPAVAYNFVYRAPRTANEWQLWYFASRDPDIARALARHFFWAESILWREDLAGRRVGVVLSGRDQIVDADEVRRYLTLDADPAPRWVADPGDIALEVLWYPDLDHSKVFDTARDRAPMVEMMKRFVDSPALEPKPGLAN